MKKNSILLRFLCGIVDFIIIMAPIQFLMMGVFQVSVRQADLFFKLLYAVYGALMTEYFGMSLGKYFGRLKVLDVSGAKTPILYSGLRELSKSMYFIPYIGWTAGLISLGMMAVRKDGRALHDFIGNTRVFYACQTRAKEGNPEYDNE